MRSIRRLYLYSAMLASFLLVLGGLVLASSEVTRLLAGSSGTLTAGAGLVRGRLVLAGGVVLAALGAWALHGFLAVRAARQDAAEHATEAHASVAHASVAHKAYLYLGQAAALGVLLAQCAPLATALFRLLLRQATPENLQWPERQIALLAGAAIALGGWAFLRRAALRDGDFGREGGAAASLRRAYFYSAVFAGLVLASAGAGELLRAGWAVAAGSAGPDAVAPSLALLVIGALLALAAWRRASRLAEAAPAVELSSLARVTLIHGAILVGTVVTLACLGYLLWRGLLALSGASAPAGLLSQPGTVVAAAAYLPVALLLWVMFVQASLNDADLGGEPPEVAVIRRICRYLVTACALGALWAGVTQLAALVGLALFRSPATAAADPSGLRERFSLAAALVLVGAPAWWGHWWTQHVRARRQDAAGADERASTVRRLYLLGVLAAAAVTIGAAVVAAVPQLLKGGAAALPGGGAAVLVALVWGVAHAIVLYGDRRLQAAGREPTGEASPAAGPLPVPVDEVSFAREALPSMSAVLEARAVPESPAPPDVVVVDGGDGRSGAALLRALRQALPDLAFRPVGLSPAAQAVMGAAAGTAGDWGGDLLAQARFILGSSDILTPGGLAGAVSPELAAAIAASPAQKLLLPPRDPSLRWVGAPDWPLERWIENAVAELAELAKPAPTGAQNA